MALVGCAAPPICVFPQIPAKHTPELKQLGRLTCQPYSAEAREEDPMLPWCQPTQIDVRVCASETEENCKIHDALFKRMSYEVQYRRYIESLRSGRR